METIIYLAATALIIRYFWKSYQKRKAQNQPQQQPVQQPVQQQTSPYAQQGGMQPVPVTTKVTSPMTARDQRISNVTRSLFAEVCRLASSIGAVSYYLPREDPGHTAEMQRGIPYLVTFITKAGMRCYLFENCLNSDTVRVLKEVYLTGEPAGVPETADAQQEAKAEAEAEPEKSVEAIAQEWWTKNWSELEATIDASGGQVEIVLDTEKYRIPCEEIAPFVKQYLETATKGAFTLDSINEDLIGLVVPVFKEEPFEAEAEAVAEG